MPEHYGLFEVRISCIGDDQDSDIHQQMELTHSNTGASYIL